MPRIFKSGKEFKGNENSGRKSIQEEVQDAIEMISTEALIELAKMKVFKQLNQEINFAQTKEMALPVALKGITDKKDLTLNIPKPIDDILKDHSIQENKEPNEED